MAIPIPDGTIDQADRQALAGKYAGILAGGQQQGGGASQVAGFLVAWAVSANTLLGGE